MKPGDVVMSVNDWGGALEDGEILIVVEAPRPCDFPGCKRRLELKLESRSGSRFYTHVEFYRKVGTL